MEEETATPMETDVSSTTQDIPAAQDVQASSSTMEVTDSTMEVTVEVAETTVEVEEVKEEDQDRSIDSNTPETNKEKFLGKAAIVSSPLTPTKQDLASKTTLQKTIPQKLTPQKATPLKVTPQKVTPLKVTHVIVDEASSSDSNVESNTSSLKDPLTPASETILPDLTTEIDIPLDIKVDSCPVKIISTEVSQDSIVSTESATPEIVIITREKEDSNESQFTETSTTESTEKLHKSIRRELRSLINSTKKDDSNESFTNETFTTETSEKENKNLSRELRSLLTKKDESTESQSTNETSTTEFSEKEHKTLSRDLRSLMAKKDDLNESTNETSTTEVSEKEHKSISRELKSLIKSAKESKIINECTQLTSKTRKSRTQNDSLNSTLNTSVEGKKIQARRGSDHSQVSNCSELDTSQEAHKRSMRSQNPDFASKQKQFISSVTARLQKDDADGTPAGSDEEIAKIKVDSAKKKPATPEPSNEKHKKLQVDPYCWRCHYLIEDVPNEKKHPPAVCSICPREYHFKCLAGTEKTLMETDKKWVCPECLNILVAEDSETRSPAMRKTNLAMLCDLLKYALNRMMEANGVEPFINPVDRNVFPDYDKYVVHPMDLTLIKESIGKGLYGSTEAFIADVCWILHNSIIFNTLQSKLTAVARTLVRSAKQEMSEIEACPECYSAANARRPTWFTDVCSTPHILLWAKLKGFPYWPAKGMSVNASGMVDVRFFGAHDRAWVYPKDCFLYSEKDPNNFRTKRQDILDSMQEAENHIRNIARKFGKFIYPEFRVAFDPSKMSEQLSAMIPGYVEEFPRNVVKDKPNVSSPSPAALSKRRSISKSSKDHDGETSDGDESPTASKKKALDVTESPREDKSSESDKPLPKLKAATKPIEASFAKSRKRRRSMLEEATTMTILEAPSKRKKRVNSFDTDVSSSPSILQKSHEIRTIDRPKTPKLPKEDKHKTPKPKHSTPKIVLKTVPVQKKTPQSVDKPKPKPRRDKSSSSDKDKGNEKNKSISNTPQSKSNTPKGTAETTDKTAENSTPKTIAYKSILKDSATKESDGSNSNSAKTTPNRTPMPRSVKDKIVFDDDTTLAVLAKSSGKPASPKPNMLTITNVRSLSQPSTSKSPGSNTNSPILRSIAPAPSVSAAITNKSKRQEQVKTIVGTVGVRSFARMTSPTRETPKTVEIEVKAEPMDFEDAERQNQKIEMLNAFRLRPVNPPAAPATSLRQVRVTKGSVIAEKPPEKTPEPRPKAKKSFPQPKKPDESRSELNGKNSMVYIPIQPPMTQAPSKQAKMNNGPVPAGPPTLRHSSAFPNNAPSGPATSMVPVPAPPSLTMSPTAAATVSAPGGGGGVRPANVQTVPLITSVNGQWTFSLQPVISVGAENPNPPLVNGLPQPGPMVPTVTPGTPAAGAPHAEPPRLMSSPTATGNVGQDTSTPGEPPRLQQKPLQANPFEAKAADAVAVPSEAGPVNAKLNQNANKLADFFRSLLEDSLEKLNNPAALVTKLKSEIEKLRWTHKQEITELQHNHELQMTEMRTSFMKEKNRALAECRRNCATDLDVAVRNAKCKQWCANCRAEAQFYCCWNTSYCDYSCQRAHWAHHYAQCTQQRDGGGDGGKTASAEDRLQPPTDLPKVSSSNTVTVGGKVLPPRVLKNAAVRPPTTASRPATTAVRPQGKSLIVINDRDGGGAKCLGTYKPATSTPQNQYMLNKPQLKSNDEASKKMVSSGGYLIIGGDSSPTANSPIVIN